MHQAANYPGIINVTTPSVIKDDLLSDEQFLWELKQRIKKVKAPKRKAAVSTEVPAWLHSILKFFRLVP